MNSVKVKLIKFKLKGELNLPIGQELDFKAIDRSGKEVKLSDYKGKKVLSLFPDINTSVCDLQTQRIAMLADKRKDLIFISVSTDDVETINKWCLSRGVDNIIILSDKKYGELGDKTNLLIPKLKKLARGFIVLDEDNKIQEYSFKEQIAELPDFEMIEKIK